MNECKTTDAKQSPHCWHATGVSFLTQPPKKEQQCCFCGKKRAWRMPIIPLPGNHGPHVPNADLARVASNSPESVSALPPKDNLFYHPESESLFWESADYEGDGLCENVTGDGEWISKFVAYRVPLTQRFGEPVGWATDADLILAKSAGRSSFSGTKQYDCHKPLFTAPPNLRGILDEVKALQLELWCAGKDKDSSFKSLESIQQKLEAVCP